MDSEGTIVLIKGFLRSAGVAGRAVPLVSSQLRANWRTRRPPCRSSAAARVIAETSVFAGLIAAALRPTAFTRPYQRPAQQGHYGR